MAPIVHFPEFRNFKQAWTEADDAMMALLIGGRLGRHLLSASEGSPELLGALYPTVIDSGRLNRTVGEAHDLIESAERYFAYMAIPYVLSVYGDFLAQSISLLRAVGLSTDTDEPRDIELSKLHNRFCAAAKTTVPALPPVQLELFEFTRWIRNRIIHRVGTSGSTLPNHYRQVLSSGARKEWERVTKRPPSFGSGSVPMGLGAPELLAALAITKRLADGVNAILQTSLTKQMWIQVVLSDYAASVPGPTTSKGRKLVGFARTNYRPLGLVEADFP